MASEKINLSEFEAAVDEILADFVKEEYGIRQKAIEAGAAVMVERLINASPRDDGEFAASWEVKKYSDASYVHNTKKVDGGGKKDIPLVNILEYREGGRPFVRQTAEAAESEVFNAIKTKIDELNGG